jgi:hypothetical protein
LNSKLCPEYGIRRLLHLIFINSSIAAVLDKSQGSNMSGMVQLKKDAGRFEKETAMRDLVIEQYADVKPAASAFGLRAYRLLASLTVVAAIPLLGAYVFEQVQAGQLPVWPYPLFALLSAAILVIDWALSGKSRG